MAEIIPVCSLVGCIVCSSSFSESTSRRSSTIVLIDSTPQGAEVFDHDGKSVGKTPVKLELPISDLPLEYELRLAGYKKKSKQIIVSGNTMVSVPLDRAPVIESSVSRRDGVGNGRAVIPVEVGG